MKPLLALRAGQCVAPTGKRMVKRVPLPGSDCTPTVSLTPSFAQAAVTEFRSFCLEQSQLRAQFVGELQQEVRSLGGDPEKTGSAAGAVARNGAAPHLVW